VIDFHAFKAFKRNIWHSKRFEAHGKINQLNIENDAVKKQLQSAQSELKQAASLRFELEEERNRSKAIKNTYEEENSKLRKEISDLRSSLHSDVLKNVPAHAGKAPKFSNVTAEV